MKVMLKRTLLVALLVLMVAAISVCGFIGVAAENTGTTMTLDEFVTAVNNGNGTYDGANVTVNIAPVGGTAGENRNIPDRIQSYGNPSVYYAQYQLFAGLTDVSISNVNFTFTAPTTDITVIGAHNPAPGATVTTSDDINGELQFLNNGAVTLTNCTFDTVAVSIYSGNVNTGSGTQTIGKTDATVTGCEFKGLLAYAIKDVSAKTVSVTDSTFSACNGGFWLAAAPDSITATNNTFTDLGRRGAIQFSSAGDYTDTVINVTSNEVVGNGALLWQLNSTVPVSAISEIMQSNTYETAYTDNSWLPVACVGETGYATIADALAAANGAEVKLLADATLDTSINVTDLKLDLNSHTLTLATGDHFFYGDNTFKNGTISIDNCQAAGNGIFNIGDSSNAATIAMENVDLVGSNFQATWAVLVVYDGSELAVTGGEWTLSNEGSSSGGVIKSASDSGVNCSVTFTGTVLDFTNIHRGITGTTAVLDDVTLTITGTGTENDTFFVDNGINGAALTIKNSTINITGCVGHALTVANHDVTIENSEINCSGSGKGDILFTTENTFAVKGFSTLNVDNVVLLSSIGNNTPVTDLLDFEDTVTTNISYAAQIGGTPYKTFAEAFAAAVEGDTIILLADLTLSSPLNITANITIDGNNHIITSTATGSVFTLNAGLTLRNVIVNNNVENTAAFKLAVDVDLTLASTAVINAGRYLADYDLIAHSHSVTVEGLAHYNALVAEGYYLEKQTNNVWTISEHAAAKIGSTLYSTLEYALEAAQDGDTIIILQNITLDTTLDITKSLIFSGNFTLISSSASPVFNIDANASLTLNCGVQSTATDGKLLNAITTQTIKTNNAAVCDMLNAEGYAMVETATGVWTLKAAMAQIGDKNYASLADALNAVQDGETVVLLADATLNATANIAGAVTINGNGFAITSTAPTAFLVSGNLTLNAALNNTYATGSVVTLVNGASAAFNGAISANKILVGFDATLHTITTNVQTVAQQLNDAGYALTEDAGVWTVKSDKPEAAIDGWNYVTLKDAIAVGGTVTLLKDVTLDAAIWVKEGSLTLTGSYTLTVNGTHAFYVDQNATLAINCKLTAALVLRTDSAFAVTTTVKAVAEQLNAERYALELNNGVYTVTSDSPEAAINGWNYKTLAFALAQAKENAMAGVTIDLLRNITTDKDDLNIEVDITLDGHNFTITSTPPSGKGSMRVRDAQAVIKNLKLVSNKEGADAFVIAHNSGSYAKVTIIDCTITSARYGVYLFKTKSCDVIISNTTINSADNGVYVNTTTGDGDNNIILTDVTINASGGSGFYSTSSKKLNLTLDGNTIINIGDGYTGNYGKGIHLFKTEEATIVVKGNTVINSQTHGIGIYGSAAALTVQDNVTINTVKNGAIDVENAGSGSSAVKDSGSSITVTGAVRLNGANYDIYTVPDAKNVPVTINGITSYAAVHHCVRTTTARVWFFYDTLTDALDSPSTYVDGENTVILYKSVSDFAGVTVAYSCTIDGNGNSVTAAAGKTAFTLGADCTKLALNNMNVNADAILGNYSTQTVTTNFQVLANALNAEGYALVAADGVWTINSDNPEAAINGWNYATLADAIGAADANAVVEILRNLTVSATINVNKAVVINGNGKTVNGDATATNLFAVVNAALTLNKITVVHASNTVVNLSGDTVSLTVTASNLSSVKSAIYFLGDVASTVTVALADSTLTSRDSHAVYVDDGAQWGTKLIAHVSITNCIANAGGSGYWVSAARSSTLEVTGGTITAVNDAVYVRGYTKGTFTNVEMTATSRLAYICNTTVAIFDNCKLTFNNTDTSKPAIYCADASTPTLTLKNGTVLNATGSRAITCGGNNVKATITIENATITAKNRALTCGTSFAYLTLTITNSVITSTDDTAIYFIGTNIADNPAELTLNISSSTITAATRVISVDGKMIADVTGEIKNSVLNATNSGSSTIWLSNSNEANRTITFDLTLTNCTVSGGRATIDAYGPENSGNKITIVGGTYTGINRAVWIGGEMTLDVTGATMIGAGTELGSPVIRQHYGTLATTVNLTNTKVQANGSNSALIYSSNGGFILNISGTTELVSNGTNNVGIYKGGNTVSYLQMTMTGGSIKVDSSAILVDALASSLASSIQISGGTITCTNADALAFELDGLMNGDVDLTNCTVTANKGFKLNSSSPIDLYIAADCKLFVDRVLLEEGYNGDKATVTTRNAAIAVQLNTETFAVTKNGDLYTVEGLGVALLNGTYYASWQAVINVANATDVIELVRNATASTSVTISSNITINGNGKTLTSSAEPAVLINSGATLVLDDASITASAGSAIKVLGSATLQLSKVNLSGSDRALYLDGNDVAGTVTVTLNSGKLEGGLFIWNDANNGYTANVTLSDVSTLSATGSNDAILIDGEYVLGELRMTNTHITSAENRGLYVDLASAYDVYLTDCTVNSKLGALELNYHPITGKRDIAMKLVVKSTSTTAVADRQTADVLSTAGRGINLRSWGSFDVDLDNLYVRGATNAVIRTMPDHIHATLKLNADNCRFESGNNWTLHLTEASGPDCYVLHDVTLTNCTARSETGLGALYAGGSRGADGKQTSYVRINGGTYQGKESVLYGCGYTTFEITNQATLTASPQPQMATTVYFAPDGVTPMLPLFLTA